MSVSANDRFIILPNGSSELKLLKLPYGNNTCKTRTCVLSNDQLYELKEITGKNPYNRREAKRIVVPKTGAAVKSMILEFPDGGYVRPGAELIVSSKFNFTYVLISLMWDTATLSKRFMTLSDIIDSIAGKYTDECWASPIPEKLYESSLKNVCETIEENGDVFFKYSQEKVLSYLNLKVNTLAQFLKDKKRYSVMRYITEMLYPSYSEKGDNSIPQDVLEMSIFRHSIDLIFSSYLPDDLRVLYLKKHDFSKLNEYIISIESERKKIELAEKNLNEVMEITSAASANKRSSRAVGDKAKKPTKKKQLPKVATGKGALDNFFKRA